MEEESNIACFLVGFWVGHISVCISEILSHFLDEFKFAFSFQVILFDFFEIEIIDDESSGHDVILVDGFDESLDSSLFDELFLVDFSLDFLWVSGDANQDKMWEFVFLHLMRLNTLFPSS